MIQGALCGIRHIEESDLPAFFSGHLPTPE